MRTVMETARSEITDLEVSYRRLPITAESVLDVGDSVRLDLTSHETNLRIQYRIKTSPIS